MDKSLVQLALAGGLVGLGFVIPKKYPSARSACWNHSLTLGVPALIDIISPPATSGLYPNGRGTE